jgi:hypothetical protein
MHRRLYEELVYPRIDLSILRCHGRSPDEPAVGTPVVRRKADLTDLAPGRHLSGPSRRVRTSAVSAAGTIGHRLVRESR